LDGFRGLQHGFHATAVAHQGNGKSIGQDLSGRPTFGVSHGFQVSGPGHHIASQLSLLINVVELMGSQHDHLIHGVQSLFQQQVQPLVESHVGIHRIGSNGKPVSNQPIGPFVKIGGKCRFVHGRHCNSRCRRKKDAPPNESASTVWDQ